ncbi:plancitoxin-1 isoform X2 [Zootermopsis nevadensis]|uniref:plancitoxin-1 isoform X2 n=1 Tax=Zootermopsis nevadensis TaxID=136037 RepID=UPI000B8E6D41|nr:plancitoxin-1 isoform X2 [Zootermopsis nevadensis]
MTTLFVFLALLCTSQCLLQCRDERNKPVDWCVIYKLPRIKTSSNSLIRKGVAYAYITSSNISRGWAISDLSINDTKSVPGRILQPLYNSSHMFRVNSLLWVLYNDQAPDKTYRSELGHTKGVVMAEADKGFWLVHSVPHFPPLPDNVTNSTTKFHSNGYSYPLTGRHYGQSFLCVSLNTSQLDLVGIQLTYNEPFIYGSNIPVSLESNFPHLIAATRNERVKVAPWFHQQEIISLAGQTFYSFAKAGKFDKELYFDWVAPALQTSLLVETWRNGRGKLPSSCNSTFMVENISSVSLNAGNINFKSTEDHSKWVTAYGDDNTTKYWVCIGDINRMSFLLSEKSREKGWWYCLRKSSQTVARIHSNCQRY